jgi:HSP20 family protein
MADKRTTAEAAHNGARRGETTRGGQFYLPNCDIVEKGEELLVMADIPGTRRDAIDVRFEDGTLTIHAEVEPRPWGVEGRPLLREYGIGDYYRTFQVSESIDAGKISADYVEGVLTLHLPKAESLKPRKIAVNAG